MTYAYTTRGGIQVGGCSKYTLVIELCYTYAIGSLVFSKTKAMKGVYERCCIKNVRFDMERLSLYRHLTRCDALKPLYIDTFNGYWNEDELVSYDTAKTLVEDYIIQSNAAREQMAMRCQ